MKVSTTREALRIYDGEAWSNIPECNESSDTRSRSHRPCLFGTILLAMTFCRLAKSPLQIQPQRGVFVPISEAKPRSADRSRSFHGSLWRFSPWELV